MPDADCVVPGLLRLMCNKCPMEEGVVENSIYGPNPQGFYRQCGKRWFDASVSLAGLVLLGPFMVLIAIFIKLTSPGPAFYRQRRVGKGGRTFDIFKFRTMVVNAYRMGPPITRSGDSRITWAGRILRFAKLDELPQLLNVLRGEMSLVGPRPETPQYVRLYTLEQRMVLSVRPGITDLASIRYWNEEELLAAVADYEQFYHDTILPAKLVLNMQYVKNISFLGDLWLIVRTLPTMVRGDAVTLEKRL